MRIAALVFVVLAMLLAVVPPVAAQDENASISRNAAGPQGGGGTDPLGGPHTPRVYGLGQPLLFGAGLALLIAAAVLGAYTLFTARPIDEP